MKSIGNEEMKRELNEIAMQEFGIPYYPELVNWKEPSILMPGEKLEVLKIHMQKYGSK